MSKELKEIKENSHAMNGSRERAKWHWQRRPCVAF